MISMASRSGVPSAISLTPSCWTAPVTVTTIVPGDFSVPTERNQSDPWARIAGRLDTVSRLFTSVGGSSLPPSAGDSSSELAVDAPSPSSSIP